MVFIANGHILFLGFADSTSEEIVTDISQFNKNKFVNYIIKHGDLASQKLLKLAVSYRFSAYHYSGNPNGSSESIREFADEEELRLIRDIVLEIVQDYNRPRKQLNLPYSEDEFEAGIPRV